MSPMAYCYEHGRIRCAVCLNLEKLERENADLRAENSALRSALDIAKEALGLIVIQRENFPEAAAERSLGFAVNALEELKTRGEK